MTLSTDFVRRNQFFLLQILSPFYLGTTFFVGGFAVSFLQDHFVEYLSVFPICNHIFFFHLV